MESSKDFVAVAKRWYELWVALAPDFGYPEDGWTAWDDLPEYSKRLNVAVVTAMIGEGTIR